jgi:ATP/maltotriose-dependent transcriptional regulator MalT
VVVLSRTLGGSDSGHVRTGTEPGTEPVSPGQAAASYSAVMGGDDRFGIPLVGRDAERAALAAESRRVRNGAFRCVLLQGEPGVGKTRLAQEFLFRSRGRVTGLRARGYPLGAAMPFGLWAELFDTYLRGRPADEVRHLCGDLVEDLAGLLRTAAAVHGSWRPNVSPAQLREALAVLLANLARPRPVVILLDDVHLADASSWEALGYLARTLTEVPVLVLACARLDELVERSVARHVLFGLEQEGLLTRLQVERLGAGEVRELAERLLGRPRVPPALGDWLYEQSRGNPLFAVSLLQELVDGGADLSSPQLASLPLALSDQVMARVEGLDDGARETLAVLAVMGRRIDLSDLQRFDRRSPGVVAAALQRLAGSQLLVEHGQGAELAYEISHPLVREAIYQSLGARRPGLHRRLARALEAAGRLGEAASHYARSAEPGDPEAMTALVRALRHTWSQFAFAEAFVILDSLADLLPAEDQRWIQVLDAMPQNPEWTSSYHHLPFDPAPGVKALRMVQRALTGRPADPARLALVNSYLAGLLAWCLGELEEGTSRAAAAVQLYRQAGQDAPSRLAVTELAWIQGLAGRYADQEATTRRVLAAAEAAAEHDTVLEALGSLAAAAYVRGRFTHAEAALRRSVALAQDDGNPARVRYGLTILGLMLLLEGRLPDARSTLQQAEAVSDGFSDPLERHMAVQLAWEAGDLPRVADEGLRVAALLSPVLQAWTLTFVVLATAETGDLGTARRYLDLSGELLGGRRMWIISDQYTWAAGRLALAEGDAARAVSTLDAAATAQLDTDALPYAVPILADLAEAAMLGGRADVARQAAAKAAEAARVIDRDHHRGLAVLAAAAAALAAGDHEPASRQAREALRLLGGYGHRLLEARVNALLGRALIAADRSEAIQRLEHATELFAACSARWRRQQTLMKLQRLGKPGQRAAAAAFGAGSLTEREHQVVALAVEGLTAKAIGRRLHIGERTVETHLAHAYAKLGVRSRWELARLPPATLGYVAEE